MVDSADREKIIGHIFGNQRGAVEQRLGASGKAEEGLFSKLLPMLAPLVMSWLAGQLTDKAGSGTAGGSGGGLGDLLGGMLGGEKEKGKQAMPDLGSISDMFSGGDDGDGGGFDIGDLLKRR